MVNLLLSFFEVFNSNFNILNVLSPFSLKITIHYRKVLFLFLPKYLLFQNSSFQENAKTKVYALEDSLGVDATKHNKALDIMVSEKKLFSMFSLLAPRPLF